MLSGGLDSSLVVAMMRKQTSGPIHTFSVGFESAAFDESEQAALTAADLGTVHHSALVRSDQAVTIADRILRHMGEPYGFPSAIASWTMYQLARRDVTVVLTGDGSDEMFCGYRRYQRLAALTGPQDLADRYESVLADGVPSTLRSWLYSSGFRSGLAGFPVNHLRSRFDQTDATAGDLERAMQVDATFWLSDAQLVKIDRMAMAHSVEPRSPMLDHRLVGYVRGIPARLNLQGDAEKLVLKAVAERYLPPRVVGRRKQELAVPLEEWLTSALRPTITRTLLSQTSLDRGYFDPDRLRAYVQDFAPDQSYPIWTLYMLERWHQLDSISA
jgi:asparagine synthase (glutamine-hydrolysing)